LVNISATPLLSSVARGKSEEVPPLNPPDATSIFFPIAII